MLLRPILSTPLAATARALPARARILIGQTAGIEHLLGIGVARALVQSPSGHTRLDDADRSIIGADSRCRR